jgi:hypothetical protein
MYNRRPIRPEGKLLRSKRRGGVNTLTTLDGRKKTGIRSILRAIVKKLTRSSR